MTIYVYNPEKDPKDVDVEPEVVTEPLTPKKDDCEAPPKHVRVTYFPKTKRSCWIHMLLCPIITLILAAGIIGLLDFFQHINKRTYSGVCGVKYYDNKYSELRGHELDSLDYMAEEERPLDVGSYIKEDIEVSPMEEWEYLHTPRFDEVRETAVWHDFKYNYSAIVDHTLSRCHIMRLNKTAIAPPRNLLDLVDKLLNGYYYKMARVIRQNYQIKAVIQDLRPYGDTIFSKCYHYDSFWVERATRVSKRSAGTTLTYALLGNHIDDQEIYKIFIKE